jgi:hypothetical protein
MRWPSEWDLASIQSGNDGTSVGVVPDDDAPSRFRSLGGSNPGEYDVLHIRI